MTARPKIVVTRELPAAALAPLHRVGDVWISPHDRALTTAELITSINGAAAVVSMLTDPIGDEVLSAAGPGLRVVANTAVGYDNLDLAAFAHHGVIATNTPGVLVDATADLTMALLLAVTRRVAEGDRLIRSGAPWSWDVSFMLGDGLQGKRLGIIGMGHIGQAVARRAVAFGMSVVHAGRRSGGCRPGGHSARRAAGDFGCRLTALPVDGADAPSDRQRRPVGDETERLPDQHRSWTGRR